jgi:hypothetical protein
MKEKGGDLLLPEPDERRREKNVDNEHQAKRLPVPDGLACDDVRHGDVPKPLEKSNDQKKEKTCE